MKSRLFAVMFCAFGAVACTTATMTGIMDSWLGAPLDEAIAQWGYPDEERQVAGHHLYVWHHDKSGPTLSSTTGSVSSTGFFSATTLGTGSRWECTRILEVDATDHVVSYQWEGNNCPFAEAMEYSTWRRRS